MKHFARFRFNFAEFDSNDDSLHKTSVIRIPVR